VHRNIDMAVANIVYCYARKVYRNMHWVYWRTESHPTSWNSGHRWHGLKGWMRTRECGARMTKKATAAGTQGSGMPTH